MPVSRPWRAKDCRKLSHAGAVPSVRLDQWGDILGSRLATAGTAGVARGGGARASPGTRLRFGVGATTDGSAKTFGSLAEARRWRQETQGRAPSANAESALSGNASRGRGGVASWRGRWHDSQAARVIDTSRASFAATSRLSALGSSPRSVMLGSRI